MSEESITEPIIWSFIDTNTVEACGGASAAQSTRVAKRQRAAEREEGGWSELADGEVATGAGSGEQGWVTEVKDDTFSLVAVGAVLGPGNTATAGKSPGHEAMPGGSSQQPNLGATHFMPAHQMLTKMTPVAEVQGVLIELRWALEKAGAQCARLTTLPLSQKSAVAKPSKRETRLLVGSLS